VIARGFPAQLLAQCIGIDADQEQPGRADVTLSRGPRQLRGRGEMNVAVPAIVGAAAINALAFRLAPGRSRADFVDDAQARDSCLSLSLLWFFRESRQWQPTVSALRGDFKRWHRPCRAELPGAAACANNYRCSRWRVCPMAKH